MIGRVDRLGWKVGHANEPGVGTSFGMRRKSGPELVWAARDSENGFQIFGCRFQFESKL
jgi:hypothetical protein